MLENRIIFSLSNKHLLKSTTYMHDSTPPHIAGQVIDSLRKLFENNRVLSCQFRHTCPPRSLDLNPCDYWL